MGMSTCPTPSCMVAEAHWLLCMALTYFFCDLAHTFHSSSILILSVATIHMQCAAGSALLRLPRMFHSQPTDNRPVIFQLNDHTYQAILDFRSEYLTDKNESTSRVAHSWMHPHPLTQTYSLLRGGGWQGGCCTRVHGCEGAPALVTGIFPSSFHPSNNMYFVVIFLSRRIWRIWQWHWWERTGGTWWPEKGCVRHSVTVWSRVPQSHLFVPQITYYIWP